MAQFRTKARAVDLLGRGQIADLPTAITELWKNGFDAYALKLSAEIYLKGYKNLKEPLFLMTDNGKGMSRADIFEKWLVLGTDSKSRNETEQIPSIDTLWQPPRIKAGEKGIGRLSVAFLGSPMLMLTKRLGYPLQAMFFDWRLLENYNLFLDDVQIPIEDVTTADNFNQVFEKLKADFLINFKKVSDADGNPIWEQNQLKLKKEIEESVRSAVIPSFFEEEILFDLLDIGDDNGTKFLIFEPIEQILSLLNTDEENNDSEFVRTSLAGFTNQFVEDTLPVETSFPIHKEIGRDSDYLTQSGKFFVPKDFKLADVLIEGVFDGNGTFNGKLKIYDNEPIDYTHTNPRRKDSRNFYGSFPMKVGYSLGERVDTKLDDGTFDEITKKVNAFGALYIYRDNFRVLPYGRTDYDFLEFEKRRSKRAGTYFFSHRRMFGYIGLTRKLNPELKDKSSREGLINNAQYRVFKSDLESLFIELAKDYFSDTARKSIFLDEKAEKNDQKEAIQKDKKRETVAKRNFTNSLKEYPKRFQEYQRKYTGLVDELIKKNESAGVLYVEIEKLLDNVQKLDIEYNELLPQIPRAYKPTEAQLQRLFEYEGQLVLFNETIKENSKTLIETVRGKLEVQELQMEFTKQLERFKGELESIIYKNKQDLDSKFRQIADEYSERSGNILKEISYNNQTIINSIQSRGAAIDILKEVQNKFEFLREQINKELIPLVNHIKKLTFDIDEELVQGAYKAEYETIKYQWEQTRETAQLGIAVEIIDHEFNVLYSQINIMLQRLDTEIPDNSGSVFNNLKKAFSSLEDKYALLSPLYRISGANSKNIVCSTIFNYLKDFFERKIRDEKIEFTATPAFLNHIIEIKEPVIHTVFINIVNNAIFWLRNAEVKKILFDYFDDTKELLIINSGLPIEDYRLTKIFDLFYSNRPNGRGIGLYLSKQSLNESYFDIYATNDPLYNVYNGACFVIRPTTDQ